jgi:hypothetical protein
MYVAIRSSLPVLVNRNENGFRRKLESLATPRILVRVSS